jgi:hypothetical protein
MELFNMVESSDYFANPDNWKLKSELELIGDEDVDSKNKIEHLILSMTLDSRVNYD